MIDSYIWVEAIPIFYFNFTVVFKINAFLLNNNEICAYQESGKIF